MRPRARAPCRPAAATSRCPFRRGRYPGAGGRTRARQPAAPSSRARTVQVPEACMIASYIRRNVKTPSIGHLSVHALASNASMQPATARAPAQTHPRPRRIPERADGPPPHTRAGACPPAAAPRRPIARGTTARCFAIRSPCLGLRACWRAIGPLLSARSRRLVRPRRHPSPVARRPPGRAARILPAAGHAFVDVGLGALLRACACLGYYLKRRHL